MSWQRVRSYFRQAPITAFIGALTGVAIGVYFTLRDKDDGIKEKGLHASWTANFEPSIKWDKNWDRRDPASLVKPPKGGVTEGNVDYENKLNERRARATRHLLLIRHGQYYTDAEASDERKLTKLGQIQADLTGQRLKLLNFPYTSMISSTMIRAMETADIIHKHIPHLTIERCPYLCEGAPIPPEPPIGHWKPEKHQFYEDGARIEAAYRKYFHRADPEQKEDSYEILVFHANVIRYFVCRALQFPPEAWLRISLMNGSITWVVIRPSGRIILRTLSDAGHMPPEYITTG